MGVRPRKNPAPKQGKPPAAGIAIYPKMRGVKGRPKRYAYTHRAGKPVVARKPNKRQAELAKLMSEGVGQTAAYRKVYGEAGNPAHTRTLAWYAAHHPTVQAQIRDLDERLITEGKVSIDKLAILRDESMSEQTQLMAASKILDGYHTMMTRHAKVLDMQQVKAPTNILIASMSDGELIKRIQELGGAGTIPGTPAAEVSPGPAHADGGSAGV